MKKLLLVILVLINVCTWAMAESSPSISGNWKTTFDNEFTNASTVAKAALGQTWDTTLQGGYSFHGSEQQYYDTSSLTYNGVNLSITASKKITKHLGVTYSYTSGVLSTYGTFQQTYGLFEVNCELPNGYGYWPAFWLKNVSNWPPEIDIFEDYGSIASIIYMTNHWGTVVNGSHPSYTTTTKVPTSVSAYHTYAVDWEPTYINWYVDGILVTSRVAGQVVNGSTISIPSVPMYMILNLAISPASNWNAPNSTSVFPQSLKVNWVRVWEKQ